MGGRERSLWAGAVRSSRYRQLAGGVGRGAVSPLTLLADEYHSQHSTQIQDGQVSCSQQQMKKTGESKDACDRKVDV
ncbi:unnamed protein product [Bubo scandiacus]